MYFFKLHFINYLIVLKYNPSQCVYKLRSCCERALCVTCMRGEVTLLSIYRYTRVQDRASLLLGEGTLTSSRSFPKGYTLLHWCRKRVHLYVGWWERTSLHSGQRRSLRLAGAGRGYFSTIVPKGALRFVRTSLRLFPGEHFTSQVPKGS